MARDDGLERAWATAATERVMVAFDGRPRASELIRTGWRLARGLKAPLLAVTVVRQRQSKEDRELTDQIRLAEDLGAEVMKVEGRDVSAELARIAHERHITQIVIGQPERSRWRALVFGSVVNRLLRKPTGADIHIVPYRLNRA
jgi:two-component system sensor histidine kinase KdpD